MALVKLQIGKNGLTNEFIENIRKVTEENEHVRISLLPSSGRDKAKAKSWCDEMLKQLGKHYTAKIIGFTIVMRKWRKARSVA